MTQLTDKVREAIIGNVGTVISGRIGTTDAELLEKRFEPTFTAGDLAKLPNFETITTVLINNTPSAPFSMSLIPPLGKPNLKLATALKRLSSAKYGHPRREVEKTIFNRLQSPNKPKPSVPSFKQDSLTNKVAGNNSSGQQPSFLDEWLAKRKQLSKNTPAQNPISSPPSSNLGSTSSSSEKEEPKQINSDTEGHIKLR